MKNNRVMIFWGVAVVLSLVSAFIWNILRETPPAVALEAMVLDKDTVVRPNPIAESVLVTGNEWVVAIESCEADEAITRAKSRGALMRELIRNDPEQALELALSFSEWRALPEAVRAHVEEPFSVAGAIHAMVSCGATSESALITDLPDGRALELFSYGDRGGLTSKRTTALQGVRMDHVGALREHFFQCVDGDDLAVVLEQFPVAVPDPGGASVASVAGGQVFYFKDRSALDVANQKIHEIEQLPGMDAGAAGVLSSLAAYLGADGAIDVQALAQDAKVASQQWTGSRRDMYVIFVDFPDNPGAVTDANTLSNQINTVISKQIWEMSNKKTYVQCVVNPTVYRLNHSSNYVDTSSAYTGSYAMYDQVVAKIVADGVDLSSNETICIQYPAIRANGYAGLASIGGIRMWLNGKASDRTITHELGHNYGVHHANTWDVTSSDPIDQGGQEVGYADFMDIMGSAPLPEGHFNVYHKWRLDWLTPTNCTRASTSGVYRIYRGDHPDTTGVQRGYFLSKDRGDRYWVGFRQEISDLDIFSRGVYLLWTTQNGLTSRLLDMTPNSAGGKRDGGLRLGQTFSDTTTEVHITPVARGGQFPNEWMDLQFYFGAFAGNRSPTATLSGPNQVSVQSGVKYAVTASDADGDALSYSWDLGDGIVHPNVPEIYVSWTAGSTGTVRCVVSDMKGGTTTVSQPVSISNPANSWSQQTSGTTQDLVDAVVGGSRVVVMTMSDEVLYSDDGSRWVSVADMDTTLADRVGMTSVIYDGTAFYAAGSYFDGAISGRRNVIYRSTGGASWSQVYRSGSLGVNYVALRGIAYGNGVYVAAGDDGALVRSTDGLTWTASSHGDADFSAVAYGSGVFAATGSTNGARVVLQSTDGQGWTDVSSGIESRVFGSLGLLDYVHDRFIGSGSFTRIGYSTDGASTFSFPSSGNYVTASGVAYGGGVYFTVGEDGRGNDVNWVSSDGVNRNGVSCPTQEKRYATLFFNDSFYTFGKGGEIWKSGSYGSASGDDG